MLTREAIGEVERTENQHHERIRSTFAKRHESERAWGDWKEATSAWHARRYPTDQLWEPAFLADLRASKRSAIEDAILVLEVDPWYFRSGYLKARLIRGLKAAVITERDRKRLWNVVWNVASGRNRQEFRKYCALAVKVCDGDLIRLLEDVSPERDRLAGGKFGYLRNYIYQHAQPSEKGRARPA